MQTISDRDKVGVFHCYYLWKIKSCGFMEINML